MKLRENDGRTVEFKLVDRNTNIDFAEDWLNAGALQRDADGAYLVDDIDYIRDYAKDAIKGCNPDVEGKLNANLFQIYFAFNSLLLDSVCDRSKMVIS